MKHTLAFPFALLASTSLALPAMAQDASPDDDPRADHRHGDENSIVIVGSIPDLLLFENVRTLDSDQIATELDGQIGEVLDTLPGVSTSGFAPGSSRPVIRGFDQDRVKLLVDGIGSIDVSALSVDHGAAIDPLIIDHIDVIQGPAALLFGGEAIGGAVNVIDRRIPREVPEDGLRVDALASYGSAADFRALSGSADYSFGNGWVMHLDAARSESDDLRVGGRLVSDGLRAELLEEADEEREEGHLDEAAEFEEAANATGVVPNSFTETTSFGGGLAWLGDRGSFGVSLRSYDSRYGVPERPGSGHHHAEGEEEGGEEGHEEEGPVTIDLHQTRGDFRGTLDLGGFFEQATIRFGFADYFHTEFEGDEVGTTFDRTAFEGRVELVQRDRDGWHGHIGASLTSSDMEIIGEEAFYPGTEDRNYAVFTLQSYDIGDLTVEGALRVESASRSNQQAGLDRDFTLVSGAAGLAYRFAGGDAVTGVHYLRTARAPSGAELLSNGLHVATQAIESGDRTFGKETSNSVEVYGRYETDSINLAATAFYIDFDGFITSFDSGEEEEGFPIYQYSQVPATFWGVELDGSVPLFSNDSVTVKADGALEYVRAERSGATPIPRIPPLQITGGLSAEFGAFSLNGEVEHNFKQDRVEAGAEPLDAYTLVNAGITWRPIDDNDRLTLSLVGHNLTDTLGRRATSFTREFIPIAGRDIRVTAQLSF
ncbi:TonB-dependent receptor [Pseudoblastomonas halimionae]|uniref:TonB-dependent receptor n=1 Tax=Alteriqipengyuania halimionae TaxID=1926630 RepID=A0A6I4U0S6_9SPHN|nr:TonB-dependent receptor [Alteriqipengyuania halimionae]MXP09560.1 TonB-dependent receptor [Alteriqipengyuania halimionae]